MPTYDYTCDNCGYEFEREQRITEAPIKECPRCGELAARRMIGGGGFILKGGGWESDLYSGPSNRSEKKAAAKSGDASSSESTKASESKAPSKKPSGGTASKSTDD